MIVLVVVYLYNIAMLKVVTKLSLIGVILEALVDSSFDSKTILKMICDVMVPTCPHENGNSFNMAVRIKGFVEGRNLEEKYLQGMYSFTVLYTEDKNVD